MNPFKIIWLKAGVAFTIPFFTALGIALFPYSADDDAQPNLIGWLIIICAPMVAGLSALSSFLSTTFAEPKAQRQSGLDDAQPPPITAAQIAAAPVTVTVPVVKPAEVPPQPKE